MIATSIKLNDGTSIPTVAFGAGTAIKTHEDGVAIIKSGLKAGYRHVDGAQMYQNSENVGKALKESGVKREDVYIVTKLGVDDSKDGEWIEPKKALQDELKKLQVEYVDLYLIHSPCDILDAGKTLEETWQSFEQLVSDGLTKSIGVSNFREEDFQAMAKVWTIKPAVNQIEYHPYVYHAPNVQRMLKLLKEHDIVLECYSPLASLFREKGGPVDEVVSRIAKEKGLLESQVLLLWAQQHSQGVVITTSRDEKRQREQLEAFKHELSREEMEEIAERGKEKFFRAFQLNVWAAAKP